LFHITSSDKDSNILNIISKQYIEMLDHNVLEPYKFINVSIYMLLLITYYIYTLNVLGTITIQNRFKICPSGELLISYITITSSFFFANCRT